MNKYPFVLFYSHDLEIIAFLKKNSDKLNCTLFFTDNISKLNKLFNPNYQIFITYGPNESEYSSVHSVIANRMRDRWIHFKEIESIERFNNAVNYCFIHNCTLPRIHIRPTFSIFTTTFNSYDKILRAYESIKKQTFIDYEWVILDDSPDDLHFSFLKQLLDSDNKVRLYKRSSNSGNIGNVKNEVVSLCRGKYVLELDHDDEILPDVLKDSVECFESDSEIGFIYMDFINIHENGNNFHYGDFICKGYGSYYSQKYNNKWVYVYNTPNINNITLSHLVCCPNHPRIWKRSVLLESGNYSEFLPICDDYEILLRTFCTTKMAKINKLGYIQYMNESNNNFSLIRNSEINRIGPEFIQPIFYDIFKVNERCKELNCYEDPKYIYEHSQIWKRKNYTHLKCNKIVTPNYDTQYCIIGIQNLIKNLEYIKELYLNPRNDFILLDYVPVEEIQKIIDSYNLDNFKCYSVPKEESVNYFLMMYKSIDNYEIIDNKKNGLFIFIGESFRTGSQDSRIIGENSSYEEQMNGSNTHINFIENLITKFNLNSISVFLSTYHTQFTDELLKIYNKYLIGSKIYDERIGLNNLFHNSLKEIENINKYDFVMYIRIDLYLKQYFTEIFNPIINKILFPCICFLPTRKYLNVQYHKIGDHPRVNDTMLFIPNKYYNYIKDIQLGHDIWHNLIKDTNLNYDNLDVILNTYHDSDSQKDFNPMYYIVNRPECKIFHSKGFIFDKNKKDPINIGETYFNTELSQRHLVINENTNPDQKYLEIGVEYGYNFDNVHFQNKIGVDPDPKFENESLIKLTSDQFFETNCDFFDTIFIDGMHQTEYVLRDFNNSISKLNNNGIIFIHDILPLNYNEQLKIPNKHVYENGILKYLEPWTGDVWKVAYYLLKYHSADFEFKYYNNENYRGVGVFKIVNKFNIPESSIHEINDFDYYKDFGEYLNILDCKNIQLTC